MKKYCLTRCFKKKLSTFWDTVLQIALGILIVAVFVIVVLGIGFLLGLVIQFFGAGLNHSALDVGMSSIGLFIFGGTILYFISKVLYRLWKAIYTMSIQRYEGTYKCNIFEECGIRDNLGPADARYSPIEVGDNVELVNLDDENDILEWYELLGRGALPIVSIEEEAETVMVKGCPLDIPMACVLKSSK